MRRPTALELQLAKGGAARVGPVDALVAARRWFLAGRRLDMQELADEIGVNRATLYRWVGSREHLLGEVLWSLAEVGLAQARAAATAPGVEGAVQFYEHFTNATANHQPMRRFVEAEPEAALRILTSKHGVQQGRLIEAVRRFLEEKAAAGELELRVDAADLAYVMVRIAESFIWREFITGEEPDLTKATQVVRTLLS